MHIFILSASAKTAEARKLNRRLKAMGYATWWEYEKLLSGSNKKEARAKAIKDAILAIVFIDQAFHKDEGDHQSVLRILMEKQEKQAPDSIFLVPVQIDGAALLLSLEVHNAVKLPLACEFQKITIVIELHGKKAKGNEPQHPFRVLLLATDKDLGETREDVADHLELNQRVTLVTAGAFDAPDPSDFQLTVLIQGWWWDQGVAAACWEKAALHKRHLILVDENARWPPRADTEWSSNGEIHSFRERHKPGLLFEDPTKLPNLIAPHIEKFQQSATPENIPLLVSDQERKYLTLQFHAWTAGHAGRQNFQSQEVYVSQLYVPLDGTSSRWQEGEDGQLVPFDPKKQKKKGKQSELLRLPLARWSSSIKDRWLAIQGAPGAGKTVFLTRFAAALAAQHLGRQAEFGDLEPNIHLPGLKTPDQRLPVPILLEATKLQTDTNPDLALLVQAISDALATCGTNMDPQEIKTKLEAGHYLLLIDALDEIAVNSSRKRTLEALRCMRGLLLHTRLLLTTRSARYTGDLAFGQEFEIVEVADLNGEQTRQLCKRFAAHKNRSSEWTGRMLSAFGQLEDHRRDEEMSLIGNPLLLTAACMVYNRLERLPRDRVQLCDHIVTDLCRARESEDSIRGWKLDETVKRQLLELLALAVQEAGAQTWPLTKAQELVKEFQPQHERQQDRIECYVQWLADHTGLIYFVQHQEKEHIRFHHRLFREYLAACRLASRNLSGESLALELFEKKQVTDEVWLDVMCLLPGTMRSQERARAFVNALLSFKPKSSKNRGSMLAVLSAVIQENLDELELDPVPLVKKWLDCYKKEGIHWKTKDRIELLKNIGHLGDPRLGITKPERWVSIEPGSFMMGNNNSDDVEEKPEHKVSITQPFYLARFPVTNAEYREFIKEGGYQKDQFWSPKGLEWKKGNGIIGLDEYPGYNLDNQPVIGVSWYEAEAWCNWCTEKLSDQAPAWIPQGFRVILPTEAQWEYAGRTSKSWTYPWGNEAITPDLANYGHDIGKTTPVGAYPRGAGKGTDLWDMSGNVFEWCRDGWDEKVYKKRKDGVQDPLAPPATDFVLRGGSWAFVVGRLRLAYRYWGRARSRGGNFGFRPCLVLVAVAEHV